MYSIHKQDLNYSFIHSMKYYLKSISLGLLILLGISIFTYQFGNAIDKEFINDYGKIHNIKPELIRTSDKESDCTQEEYFDDKYGLCIQIPTQFK